MTSEANRLDRTTAGRAGDVAAADELAPTADFDELLEHAGQNVSAARRQQPSRQLGPRAERTRQRLLDSALTLFFERGYTGTTASDIAGAAGCSLPTFYSYFADLPAVLRALVRGYIEDHAQRGIDRWDVSQGRRGLHAMVSAYVALYYEYRDFKLLWESAKIVDPAIRQLGLEFTAVYQRGMGESLQEGIAAGLIRSDHPAEDMADALTAMLDRYCYHHIALLRDDLATVIHSVSLLTDLWADSLQLVEPAPDQREQT